MRATGRKSVLLLPFAVAIHAARSSYTYCTLLHDIRVLQRVRHSTPGAATGSTLMHTVDDTRRVTGPRGRHHGTAAPPQCPPSNQFNELSTSSPCAYVPPFLTVPACRRWHAHRRGNLLSSSPPASGPPRAWSPASHAPMKLYKSGGPWPSSWTQMTT